MEPGRLRQNTLIGLFVSLVLALGKVVAGIVGHSSALVADGVESIADALGSVVVWWGLSVSEREPDSAHPYGYGRAEALAALAVGGLLLAAAVVIAVRAVEEMATPHAAPAWWTLLVLAAVVLTKAILFRVVLRGAEAVQSDAARADAWHHGSDAITSAAAFVGIAVAVWGPGLLGVESLVLADEIAALLGSVIIVLTGLRLIAPALRELLDADAPGLASQVGRVAAEVEGVKMVEKVFARKSGRGYLVDMHLHVNPDLSVREAHALAGKVKATIRARCPTVRHVLIHVEPYETGSI